MEGPVIALLSVKPVKYEAADIESLLGEWIRDHSFD